MRGGVDLIGSRGYAQESIVPRLKERREHPTDDGRVLVALLHSRRDEQQSAGKPVTEKSLLRTSADTITPYPPARP